MRKNVRKRGRKLETLPLKVKRSWVHSHDGVMVRSSSKPHFSHFILRTIAPKCPKAGCRWLLAARKESSPQWGHPSLGQRARRASRAVTRFSRSSTCSTALSIFFHFGQSFMAERMSLKLTMAISILKPKIISAGVSVCRTNTGQIVLSAHESTQRILLEVSEEECLKFARELLAFCEASREEV